jgi:hypothetical protein
VVGGRGGGGCEGGLGREGELKSLGMKAYEELPQDSTASLLVECTTSHTSISFPDSRDPKRLSKAKQALE